MLFEKFVEHIKESSRTALIVGEETVDTLVNGVLNHIIDQEVNFHLPDFVSMWTQEQTFALL